MRHLFLLATALLVCAATDPASLRFDIRFGATPTSPIGPPVPCANPTPGHELCPYAETDYVPNYETVVPQTIRSCGGSFVRFEAMTEGAERAFFDVHADRARAVAACISEHLPQGHVEEMSTKAPH